MGIDEKLMFVVDHSILWLQYILSYIRELAYVLLPVPLHK